MPFFSKLFLQYLHFSFFSRNTHRDLGNRSYLGTYLHAWRTYRAYRVWVLWNKITRQARRFNCSCCWKGQSFSSNLLILRTTLSSLFLCWFWHLSDLPMRWLSSKGGKKNECSRKKIGFFWFFFLLPENWEEKGNAIQHQCSCPMTPHHPSVTLGQGLQGGATLHRCNTCDLWSQGEYLRAWCRKNAQC